MEGAEVIGSMRTSGSIHLNKNKPKVLFAQGISEIEHCRKKKHAKSNHIMKTNNFGRDGLHDCGCKGLLTFVRIIERMLGERGRLQTAQRQVGTGVKAAWEGRVAWQGQREKHHQ